MEPQKVFIIGEYIFLLITSLTKVDAAVARRLTNISTNGKDLKNEENNQNVILKASEFSDGDATYHYIHTVPLHHFARHGLCRHEEGRKYFYKALKTKVCRLNELFVATLVEDLCKQRGSFLDKWVGEIFDIDSDGMVTHYEKRYYESND